MEKPRKNLLTDSMGLFVHRLQLSQFRCYEAERLDFSGAPVVITGENGAGKTNILEAVSLLTPGKGLRGAELSELRNRHAPHPEGWAIAAQIETNDDSLIKIGTGIPHIKEGEPQRRQIRINGAPASGSELGAYVAAVWLTPQMDRLFIEGASARRRFLDRLVYALDPSHAARVNSYDRALRERAKLLEPNAPRLDPLWLLTLEKRMAEDGIAIAASRLVLAEKLQNTVMTGDEHRFFAKPRLAVDGTLETALLSGIPALEAEEYFLERLKKNRQNQRPSFGPQRSDLCVLHDQNNTPAALCSTGEQKALLISIVLAHARLIAQQRGFVPFLLLDEVAAHIDEKRRAALFGFLEALGGQFFLTGTEKMLFEGLSNSVDRLKISNARIVAEPAKALHA